MTAHPKPAVTVIAWTRSSGRQRDLASVLGGRQAAFAEESLLSRYLFGLVRTWRLVRSLAPGEICIVTAPPVLVPAVVIAAGRRRHPIIMDSHPGAFGLMGDRFSRLLQPLHRWCIKRASLVMVTTHGLEERVAREGGRAMVFHEPRSSTAVSPTPPRRARDTFKVLFAGTFAPDEPIAEVLEAAAASPDVSFAVTGDSRRAERYRLPPNVRLTGWISERAFTEEIAAADAILVLSTDRNSVMRAAYQAVRALRPLVVSDSPATRAFFPRSIHTRNSADEIAAALESIKVAPPERIRQVVRDAAAFEESLSEGQERALRAECQRLAAVWGGTA